MRIGHLSLGARKHWDRTPVREDKGNLDDCDQEPRQQDREDAAAL